MSPSSLECDYSVQFEPNWYLPWVASNVTELSSQSVVCIPWWHRATHLSAQSNSVSFHKFGLQAVFPVSLPVDHSASSHLSGNSVFPSQAADGGIGTRQSFRLSPDENSNLPMNARRQPKPHQPCGPRLSQARPICRQTRLNAPTAAIFRFLSTFSCCFSSVQFLLRLLRNTRIDYLLHLMLTSANWGLLRMEILSTISPIITVS